MHLSIIKIEIATKCFFEIWRICKLTKRFLNNFNIDSSNYLSRRFSLLKYQMQWKHLHAKICKCYYYHQLDSNWANKFLIRILLASYQNQSLTQMLNAVSNCKRLFVCLDWFGFRVWVWVWMPHKKIFYICFRNKAKFEFRVKQKYESKPLLFCFRIQL